MILTVTLNPALDTTYEVERLEPNQSHRVLAAHACAGGKGINVARVLTALGRPAVVTGFAGGSAGAELRADLAAAGLADELVSVHGESRRTVAVVSRTEPDATVFNEPGPPITEAEWDEFTRRFDALAHEADLVVLSGSLPPGVPGDAYARLVRAARALDRPTVLDTAGPALTEAIGAGPTVVKPNAVELAAAVEAHTTGSDSATDPTVNPAFDPPVFDPTTGAALLVAAGAGAVVASLGPRGLYALTPHGAWRVAAPGPLAGNPTGAGDSCVAAIAAGLAEHASWPEILREAAALSAATVLSPVAGSFDAEAYCLYRTTISVEEVHAAHPDR